ncbi:MAG: SH3 domain-containing protein [Lachnospiraceae bacterium]|nr:SH3 domain-containing protein [Lachnospiraceae bacterium]
MNRNKKVIDSMTVVSALLVMTTITALGGSTEDRTGDVTRSVALSKNGTAGIMLDLHNIDAVPLNNVDLTIASIEKSSKDIVSKSGDNADAEFRSACGVAELGGRVAEEVSRTTETASENAEEISPAAETEAVSDVAEQNDAEAVLAEAEQPDEAVLDAGQAETLADVQAAEGIQQPEELADAQKAAAQAAEGTQQPDTADAEQAEAQAAEDVQQPDAEQAEAQTAEDVQQPDAADAEQAEAQAAEAGEWSNRVMANVQEDMNIRTAPDENSELAGKFYRGDVAEVVSVEGEWTQIASGNATGYVKNEYLVYGEEAGALANEVCSMYATVEADGLRLRSEPHEEGGVVTTAANGDKLKVDKAAEAADGWVAVYTADETAYVSADYVDVTLNLGTALNSEEVAAKEAREAEAAKAAEEAKSAETKKSAVAASTDEVTLLGALIQCEAGGSSYEGMVAVGAVVMNRVRSGGYPGSISGVVYQGGQFTPALNGSVASVLASGVRGACISAAQEAINGRDNTNGALSFRSASSGAQGTVIGGNVFF